MGRPFPGLGPTWIRLAVRDPATHAALATALAELAELPELADLASPPSSQPSTHPVPKDRR